MKNYLLLFILLFSGQKSFCQIDSFLVADHYFYSVGPELWLVEHGDSLNGDFKYNLIYTHPVRSESAFAQITIAVNTVESSTASTEVKKKVPGQGYSSSSIDRKQEKQMQKADINLSFIKVDEFTCAAITSTNYNSKLKKNITSQVYLYPINETLEISASLITNVPGYEAYYMKDSLKKLMIRFFNLNQNTIRSLNANFSQIQQVDSFTVKGESFIYPILFDWEQSRKYVEDSTDCTGKRFNLVHNDGDSCLKIKISCSIDEPRSIAEAEAEHKYSYLLNDDFTIFENIEIPSALIFSYFSDTLAIQTNPDSVHYYFSEYTNIGTKNICGNQNFWYSKQYIVRIRNSNGRLTEIDYWLSADCKSITDIIRYDEAMKIFFAYVKTYNDFEVLYR